MLEFTRVVVEVIDVQVHVETPSEGLREMRYGKSEHQVSVSNMIRSMDLLHMLEKRGKSALTCL